MHASNLSCPAGRIANATIYRNLPSSVLEVIMRSHVRLAYQKLHRRPVKLRHEKKKRRPTPATALLCTHAQHPAHRQPATRCAVSVFAAPPIRLSPVTRSLARRLPADCPLCAQALHRALHTPSTAREEDVQHYTASNVGTPQCPAFWPCQPRLSLSTPIPEERLLLGPRIPSFWPSTTYGTAHAALSFLHTSCPTLCSTRGYCCLDATISPHSTDKAPHKWLLQPIHSRSRRGCLSQR